MMMLRRLVIQSNPFVDCMHLLTSMPSCRHLLIVFSVRPQTALGSFLELFSFTLCHMCKGNEADSKRKVIVVELELEQKKTVKLKQNSTRKLETR